MTPPLWPTGGAMNRCQVRRQALGGDFIVAAPKELNEAEAMAERICQHGDSPPVVCRDRSLYGSAIAQGSCDARFDFLDHEIKVHGGPVTLVASKLGRSGRGRRAGRLDEEVQRRGTAEYLDAGGAEAATDSQPEGRRVERDGLVQVVDVDIDEQTGGRGHIARHSRRLAGAADRAGPLPWAGAPGRGAMRAGGSPPWECRHGFNMTP